MDRLHRLRYITERYEQIQGLRLVPLGIPFLLSSAWRDGRLAWVPGTDGRGARLWFLVLLLLAFVSSRAAKTYYRHSFGEVRASTTLDGPLAAFVFAALFIVAAAIPGTPHAVSIPVVVAALGLAYVGMAGGHVRPHYLAIAGSVAVFAAFPILGVSFHAREVLLDRLIGAGLIVIGLGDHFMLRRTLVPVSHVDAL